MRRLIPTWGLFSSWLKHPLPPSNSIILGIGISKYEYFLVGGTNIQTIAMTKILKEYHCKYMHFKMINVFQSMTYYSFYVHIFPSLVNGSSFKWASEFFWCDPRSLGDSCLLACLWLILFISCTRSATSHFSQEQVLPISKKQYFENRVWILGAFFVSVWSLCIGHLCRQL